MVGNREERPSFSAKVICLREMRQRRKTQFLCKSEMPEGDGTLHSAKDIYVASMTLQNWLGRMVFGVASALLYNSALGVASAGGKSQNGANKLFPQLNNAVTSAAPTSVTGCASV